MASKILSTYHHNKVINNLNALRINTARDKKILSEKEISILVEFNKRKNNNIQQNRDFYQSTIDFIEENFETGPQMKKQAEQYILNKVGDIFSLVKTYRLLEVLNPNTNGDTKLLIEAITRIKE